MQRERGRFIVIEGNDGTGKETQSRALSDKFQYLGIENVVFDFPQYESTFFGKLVSRFLKGEFGGNREVSPYLAMLPFAGDRWQASPQIREHLDSGKIVIANRYFLSNIAHQSVKLPKESRDEFIKFAHKLEYEVYGIPREDLNIVLLVSPEKSQEHVRLKRSRSYLDGGKDIHEEDSEYQVRVAGIYRILPDLYPNIVGIDCMKGDEILSVEEVHQKIWGCVETYLRKDEGRIVRDRQI